MFGNFGKVGGVVIIIEMLLSYPARDTKGWWDKGEWSGPRPVQERSVRTPVKHNGLAPPRVKYEGE